MKAHIGVDADSSLLAPHQQISKRIAQTFPEAVGKVHASDQQA